jgi:adenosine deaminase
LENTEHLLNNLRALPKIDLHRHLEGSVRLETLVDIAREFEIMLLPECCEVDALRPHVQIMPDEPRTWQHFLSKFMVLRQFFRTPEIVQRVTREAVADAAADNVKYMELRFTPQALNNLMRSSYESVVGWVCEAAAEEAAKHDITVRLIVSMNRHESIEIGESVIMAALEHRHQGVTGIDLAGQEAVFSSRPFRDLFRQAKADGLGLTVHAGEWDGAQSVREAVEYLETDRVGHGIRAVEDPSLVALLVERGTVLEVCPTSNFQSGVVVNLADHPLPALYHSHVKTTLNTDDPNISDIVLSDELHCAMREMNLTLDDVKQQMLTSAQAAFLPETERANLVRRFEALLAADEYSQG